MTHTDSVTVLQIHVECVELLINLKYLESKIVLTICGSERIYSKLWYDEKEIWQWQFPHKTNEMKN
jgi:hypothetical protein